MSAAMRLHRTLALAGPALALATFSAQLAANSSRVPLPYVDRPLVLPEGVMRLDGGPRWPDYDAQLKQVIIDEGPDLLFLNPGFSFGVAQDFELGFVVPIQVSPNDQLEDPRLYMLYGLEASDLSYGIFGEVQVGLRNDSILTAGVPLFYRASSAFRFETGGFAQVPLGDDPALNLIFPVYFSFQPTDRFYLGPEAGLGLYGVFSDGSGIATPLGGFLGYTLGPATQPLGDLYGRLRFTDVPDDGALELMFGFDFYFDL